MTRPVSLVALLLVIAATSASAHEVRPAYLELRETDSETFAVTWKVPAKGDRRLALYARLPQSCTTVVPLATRATPGAYTDRSTIICADGLAGGTVAIDGLAATLTDVLVRLEWLDGTSQVVRLTPDSPSFTVAASPSRMEVAGTYLFLGVEHILGGIDHLLFVLALLMIVEGRHKLLWTITAFTIAHSITLALATLGFVSVPSAPVEAVIALSILFLAVEIVHGQQGRSGLTARAPWVVAFTFGLLHGFGFAGALAEVGLPQASIPLALFLFNVGVELGQVLFVAAVLAALFAARWIGAHWPEETRPQWARSALASAVPTYAIGTVASFWMIQRVAAFWL